MGAGLALLRERARPKAVREHRWAPWLAVCSVCVGSFMGQLDASIVTVAYPAIERDFAAPLASVQWVSLGYLLVLVGLLAAVGRFADATGRKLVYLQGFVVFTVASAACGLAPSLGLLVIFRLVQAAGAAMLQANSVALVSVSMPRERLRQGLGLQAAGQALGLALGPTVGGLLVASVGWRWVFWINVPVGCAAIVAGHYLLPRTRERSPARRLDWPGLALLAAATTTLLLALSGVSGLGLTGKVIIALAGASCLAWYGLWRRENRTRFPLIDPALLRTRGIAAGLFGAMCGYLMLFGPLALIPQVLRGNAAHAGLVLTALPVGFAAAALTADRVLPRRWGNRRRGAGGAAVCLAALALLLLAPASGAPVIPLLALLGIGLGVFIPANNAVVMAAVPARFSGIAGGMVNMTRGVGTALGIALVTLALHAAGRTADGARTAIVMMAVTALAAIVSAAATGSGRPGDPPKTRRTGGSKRQ
ncbi:MFS transporter [Actinoallomurus spadix]|uniref:MFS transporter n=1 Tax=Actinoallomurus spadix TaxID=79912 RepID=A0ABN0XR81_9ACTN|nr:MFS transporter [Actinoallomurus spadix]MCO5991459.1 MFS transporter [Actinoallomurus spadix]